MRKNFTIYCEEEEFSSAYKEACEKAMDGFVKSDVRLAVEVLFVDGEEIRRLNSENRNIDKVTDVLSFPTLDGIKGKPLKKKEFCVYLQPKMELATGKLLQVPGDLKGPTLSIDQQNVCVCACAHAWACMPRPRVCM